MAEAGTHVQGATSPTLTLDQVVPGMAVETQRVFSLDDLRTFGALAPDRAPLHHDASFAHARGYRDVVVFGFLVAAPFSGLLGEHLPGPLSVLHSAKFGLAAPVYVGEEILYRAEVKQVSRATGAIVLDLTATRVKTGDVLLRGQAQCGFRL
jgi:acyl dehydratase